MELKTTTGVVRLVRGGIVMAERRYNYHAKNLSKEYIIKRFRHTYGEKFFECELEVIDNKYGKIEYNA